MQTYRITFDDDVPAETVKAERYYAAETSGGGQGLLVNFLVGTETVYSACARRLRAIRLMPEEN